MGRIAKSLGFLLVWLLSAPQLFAADEIHINLAQLQWQSQLGLHTTSDASQPVLNIRQFPIYFSKLYPDLDPGTYNYTLSTRFSLPDMQSHQIFTLSMEAIGEQWRVFINGNKVYEAWSEAQPDGTEPLLHYTRGKVLIIPSSVLLTGENILAIQMRGRHDSSGIFFNFLNGLGKSSYHIDTLKNLGMSGEVFLRLIVLSGLFFCGLIFVYVHLRMRSWNYFLNAGLFLVTNSLYFISYDHIAYQFFEHTGTLLRIQGFLMYPLISFAVLFIHQYFDRGQSLNMFMKVVVFVPFVIDICGPILQLGWVVEMLRVWQVLTITAVFYIWLVMIKAAKQEHHTAIREDARRFLFFCVLGGAAAIIDVTLSMMRVPLVRLTPYTSIGLCIFLIISLLNSIQRYERKLQQANRALRDEKAAIQRFVPYEILQTLGHRSIVDLKLGDQTLRRMTILFADIRSFTSMSETMSPQETFAFINSYLSRVGPVIRRHKGFIDKYIGDGIMALFPESPDNAVAAAVELQREVALFNLERLERSEPGIRVGIGIHIGDLMLGTIGEAERFEGTVISDAVNVASRVEHLTADFSLDVLMTEAVVKELHEIPAEQRFVGQVQVKGKALSIGLYEVFTHLSEKEIQVRLQGRLALQQAIEAWLAKDPKAKQLFQHMADEAPWDTVVRYYAQALELDKLTPNGPPRISA